MFDFHTWFDFQEKIAKKRKKTQVFMGHSITFHCVYFELSSVPKRETIEGRRSWKSSPVVIRCLIWFPSKQSQNRKKSQKNRKKSAKKIATNRLDRLRFFPKPDRWARRCTTAVFYPNWRTPGVHHKKGRPSAATSHESRLGKPSFCIFGLRTRQLDLW